MEKETRINIPGRVAMAGTFIESSNIISSLGWDTSGNMEAVMAGKGGIRTCKDRALSLTDFPASLIDTAAIDSRFEQLSSGRRFTRFEKLCILSVHDALSGSVLQATGERSLLILSTTKGNVELLDDPGGFPGNRLLLWRSAEVISGFFGMKQRPIVVSNACISGVVALLLARRLIASGKTDHAIVVGADVLSRFIVSGFQSFLSLSDRPCRPFDMDRDGLTLGEAAATVIVSSQAGDFELVRGATSNDANHISGPSRTGEGLYLSIQGTLSGCEPVDLISAHGTATLYNDEMEAVAISRSGLESVPVNSLKGYFGHTLGAAGIIESIINLEAMKRGTLVGTMGFSRSGVSKSINVVDRAVEKRSESMLKIASGFGGCNAAALFTKC
jgi:3-oxoacyl-[acyl-carrier-protein] synthase-1